VSLPGRGVVLRIGLKLGLDLVAGPAELELKISAIALASGERLTRLDLQLEPPSLVRHTTVSLVAETCLLGAPSRSRPSPC